MDASYSQLKEVFKQIHYINSTLAILNWDSAVIMPKGSIESRANQISNLKLIAHDLLASTKVLDLINNVDEHKLDNWNKANFLLMKKNHKQTISIDKQLTEAHSIACTKSEMIWRIAKKENNFKLFSPAFKETLSLTKQVAFSKASSFNCSIYDAMIDTYDPGLTTKDIDPIFYDLKEFLPGFITQTTKKQLTQYKGQSAHKISLPISLQKEIGLECMRILGFNFNKGRLDTSIHPFSGGHSEDTRITTTYKENDFMHGLMGILHETGHALYQQNLPLQWIEQPVGSFLGMATHESQALIFEMQFSRSMEFSLFLSNLFKHKFNLHDERFNANNLYQSLNTVKPSLIRIEADEVTYPAHVILRYELEKVLISGELAIDDLPSAWNEKMYQTFGIKPSSDSEGCLQDIHWPSGIFGYFPSYLIGAIIAAQLHNSLEKEIPNKSELVTKGNFNPLNAWLNKNVHQHASLYPTQELLVEATGEKLNISYYKKYLTRKYL